MTDLSPAAQVVRDAYEAGGLPAALRAAVDQVVPEEPWPVSMMGPVYVAEAKQRRKLRAEILAIAAELRGTDTP
jgi:hypothetical protein